MSLVPVFEIGLLNVWILVLIQFLTEWMVYIDRKAGKKATFVPKAIQKGKFFRTGQLLYLVVMLYSVFVPLKLGTTWLYAGLMVYILGLILTIVSYLNFVATPVKEPVVNGLYGISRHPQYTFGVLTLLGAGIASASWLIVLLVIIEGIFHHPIALEEEQFCLEKYGDTYREYMNRTPRWIGIPKSEKND
ncbi:MAG: isoprenylcysteine carboxylmethyltransferase family protein [Halobacteriota archaeon]|nr:isoprenylcysteine carboxylmethyltransferase family protein [Halobacteriota archaeon]